MCKIVWCDSERIECGVYYWVMRGREVGVVMCRSWVAVIWCCATATVGASVVYCSGGGCGGVEAT